MLIHAAGLDISHPLPDKPQAEYDLVFDVKADGWFNVLHALRGKPVGAAVAFSSIAGRFGNAAQTDYSAANDLLCKAISGMRRERPHARHRHRLDRLGRDRHGDARLDPEGDGDGRHRDAPARDRRARRAARAGAQRRRRGRRRRRARRPARGDAAAASSPSGGPMRGTEATITVNGGLEVSTDLDPARQAFLDDHRIDGTPVLPGVMGMEAFAETAAALAPGYAVTALEDVELQAPFKFYRDAPRTRRRSGRSCATTATGGLVADCRLTGRRTLAGGAEQATVHFTGRVRLARESLPAPRVEAPPALPAGAVVEPRRGLPRLLPRPRLPGARAGLPQQRRGARRASRTTCRRTTSRLPGRRASSRG